ncbi:MAG: FAD-binding oxidoreductase [Proteobacteria bacterium]|nr:FAD-binding oxidoreductase [Pseudomonadota bacterium]
MTLHVTVLGAGVVGVCTALALRHTGFEVSLIDPGEPGGEQAASFGNAGWLSPASVVPISMPGLWRKVPRILLDPHGPLTIRWTSLPRLLPWLLRFLYAGATVRRVEATARALRPLLEPAAGLHAELAAAADVPNMIRRWGLLYIYPTRRDYENDALAWRLRRQNGLTWTELDKAALHQKLPSLVDRYGFGAFVQAGAHCTDPGGYVAALARHAVALGVRRIRARATGFQIEATRLRAVATEDAPIVCDRAVVSAGIWSQTLARAAGDSIPLVSERGYHVVISDPEAIPDIPVQPSDTKMGNTAMVHGLRAAGQVEFSSPDALPNWHRARVLLDHVLTTYKGLPSVVPEARISRWMGHRPSTPDGLPVIGEASKSSDIVHAFGHGHVGLASAPVTASLVAAMIRGATPETKLTPYSAQRFRGWWPRPAASLRTY